MSPRIVPIRNLPPGMTGHLEFTHMPAKRDWRDRAISIATLAGAVVLAMQWMFSPDPMRLLIATWVVGYVWIAAGELRFFSPFDRRSVRAVVERTHEDLQSPQDHPANVEGNLVVSPAETPTAAGSGIKMLMAVKEF